MFTADPRVVKKAKKIDWISFEDMLELAASGSKVLSDAGVNIELISTSEIRISVVTRADDVNEAVRAVHTAFGPDSDSDEAVVYGGTGR